MVSASDFCSVFNKAKNDGWGYLPGFDGQVLTKEMIEERIVDPNIQKSASKWIGKHVVDAGGLFAYAFRTLGIYDDYASDGSYPHTIFTEFCSETGKLPKGGLIPGMVMFKKRNDKYLGVGLYIGNSRIIEAKSLKVGVIDSYMNSEWTYWGKLKDVEYEGLPSKADILKKKTPKDLRVLRGNAQVFGATKSVRVRTKASLNSDILDLLPNGYQLTVLEDLGDFCKIEYKRTGYMKKQYLQEVQSNANNK